MKNLKTTFLTLLAVSILFVACKKDDEDSTPKNQMTIAGTEYDFSQGFIENYGTWLLIEAYNFDVTLISSGLTIHEIGGEIDSISGIGHGISFELFSSDSTDLAIGEYVYDENDDGNAGTFSYAGAVVNFNAETEEGTEYDITEGKVKVSQNGGNYELSFDCKTEEGTIITGFYKGNLKLYNYTDGLKSEKVKNKSW
jgi:predicted heme/steroid binding protein